MPDTLPDLGYRVVSDGRRKRTRDPRAHIGERERGSGGVGARLTGSSRHAVVAPRHVGGEPGRRLGHANLSAGGGNRYSNGEVELK
jgi:hypothetical protein